MRQRRPAAAKAVAPAILRIDVSENGLGLVMADVFSWLDMGCDRDRE